MKKILAILLACVLLLSNVSALAEYERNIKFTATYVDRAATEVDEVYHFFCDRFNIDVEPIPVAWAAIPETNSVMIMGGTMYDVMTVPNDYGTVLSYAEQGLIKPLPEGWQEKYPNIAKAFEVGAVGDYFTVDGLTYAVPNVTYMNFIEEDYVLSVIGTYYRADWAKELGFDFGSTVTVSEFNAYLKACVEKDMAGNGQTIGLATPYANTFYADMHTPVDKLGDFVNVDGTYVWGPTVEGTVEGIKAAKQYYEEGLIDPDYFTLDAFAGQNKFSSGLAAATHQTLSAGNYELIVSNAQAAGIENPIEKIKPIVVTDDAGKLHINQVTNFNWVKVFNPELDDEAFDRILQLYDYLYTREAELVYNMGLEGVDWAEVEDGVFESYLEEEYEAARFKYPSIWFWFNTAIFAEDLQLINPATNADIRNAIAECVSARYALTKEHGYSKVDEKVQYLDTEAKRNYSVDISGEMSRLICDKTIPMDQVEAEWNAFIDANQGIWQPVVDDLNAAE